jgi:alkanesulfonate monooxygenase SsuD/methylene tetrahydromethanopterin reductase-like flavin-dependent oxidoreductase (luciferase family)
MKFGVELAGAGVTADPRLLADLAGEAEEAGWDAVFLEDYIVHHTGAPTADPWVSLAAMAGATSRVRLGTEVTALSRRRPWKVARELTTLDHLSQGRMILGVGLGDLNDPGFGAVGEATSLRKRAALVDESLAIIDGLWRGHPFSFESSNYQLNDITFQPVPVQRPRIPIWIGGGWPNPGVKTRAPRWDGICAYIETGSFERWVDHSPASIEEMKLLIESKRGSVEGYDIVTGGRTRDADWARERQLIDGLASAGATWWVEYVEPLADLSTTRAAVCRGPLR